MRLDNGCILFAVTRWSFSIFALRVTEWYQSVDTPFGEFTESYGQRTKDDGPLQ